jgi:hypothetical protein
MNTKLILSAFAATILVAASVATAAPRGAGAKVTGDYDFAPSTRVYRSAPVYRESAPATRSFSYEPAQRPAAAPAATCPQPSAAPATAQRGATVQRSFSYEPAQPTYVPAPSRRSGARTERYLLPKTDPRKYRGM